MTPRIVIATLLVALLLGTAAFVWHTEDAAGDAVKETDHYRIRYTGTAEQLYAAYTSVFPPTAAAAPGKLILVLYKDRTSMPSRP